MTTTTTIAIAFLIVSSFSGLSIGLSDISQAQEKIYIYQWPHLSFKETKHICPRCCMIKLKGTYSHHVGKMEVKAPGSAQQGRFTIQI